MKISGVILAAGRSSRMGSTNKLFLEYNSHTVVEEVLLQMLGSRLNEVIIITGFESERLRSLLTAYESERLRIIHNPRYMAGRAESIKCGVNHLTHDTQAVLFMVADKPGVRTSLIDRSIETFFEAKPRILCVKTPDGRGHPIIFAHTLFPELLELDGDLVGEEIFRKYSGSVLLLDDDRLQPDLDTYNDYHALLKQQSTD